MKKLFVVMILTCAAFAVKAEEGQSHKAFRVDLGIGYAKPKGGGGALFSIEPKYAVTPNIAVGFRVEAAGMAKVKWDLDDKGQLVDNGDTEIKFNMSYLATGDYYLMTNKFRPFVGLGLGAYATTGVSIDVNTSNQVDESWKGSKTNFGFMLRAGFDVSHVRLAVEYNFAGKDKIKKSNNYMGIKLSTYIGGGIKK